MAGHGVCGRTLGAYGTEFTHTHAHNHTRTRVHASPSSSQILDKQPELFFHLQQQRLIELIRGGDTEGALDFAAENLAPLAEEHPRFLEELGECVGKERVGGRTWQDPGRPAPWCKRLGGGRVAVWRQCTIYCSGARAAGQVTGRVGHGWQV